MRAERKLLCLQKGSVRDLCGDKNVLYFKCIKVTIWSWYCTIGLQDVSLWEIEKRTHRISLCYFFDQHVNLWLSLNKKFNGKIVLSYRAETIHKAKLTRNVRVNFSWSHLFIVTSTNLGISFSTILSFTTQDMSLWLLLIFLLYKHFKISFNMFSLFTRKKDEDYMYKVYINWKWSYNQDLQLCQYRSVTNSTEAWQTVRHKMTKFSCREH